MLLKEKLSFIRNSNSNKIAIISEEKTYSYKNIDLLVESCKRSLGDCKLPVLINVKSRFKSIILMLAAIDLDITYIPVDNDRSNKSINEIKKCFYKVRVVRDVDFYNEMISDEIEVNHDCESGKLIFDHVMAIMFTSGTTGKPKGVQVRSSSVMNLLDNPKFMRFSEKEVFLSYSSLSFDASIFEIFTPLLSGNTLVLINKIMILDDDSLQSQIEKYSISCMWMTAGLFNKKVLDDNYSALKKVNSLNSYHKCITSVTRGLLQSL